MSAQPPVATYRTRETEEHYRSVGWWDQVTLVDRVREHATNRPDAIAIIDSSDDRRITYAQLWHDASTFAAFLISRGIKPGDGVSVQLPNSYETAVVDLGVLAAGAVLNPLLPNYRAHELRHVLAVSHAKAYITPDAYRGFDHLVMARDLLASSPEIHTHVVVASLPDATVAPESFDLRDVLSNASRNDPALPTLDASAVSELIFTSGTEAAPKAIMHSEQTANINVLATVEAMDLTAQDVVWMPSPIGHSTGLNCGLRVALYAGLPIVLQDRWDPDRAAELIERERCTYTLAATTFLTDLVRTLQSTRRDVSSMRAFGCGGAPVPPDLVVAAAAVGVTVLRIYGSTEGLIITWNRGNSPLDKRANTDGLAMPNVEVEIRDDADQVVGHGVEGEIHVRGPEVCIGFFDDPERMARVFTDDGWLRSGDLGVIDAQGYLTIVGRKKEIIIRGGMNIAPREIEDLLCEMPAVRAAAVIGLPDERLGELVCACIVADEPLDLADIVAFLRARDLATYKLPQAIRVIDAIPMTASGKLRKAVLRDAIVADMARGAQSP
jgi:acyl-CoA synthetase (AMP-forming)/AMP-acid ligase II